MSKPGNTPKLSWPERLAGVFLVGTLGYFFVVSPIVGHFTAPQSLTSPEGIAQLSSSMAAVPTTAPQATTSDLHSVPDGYGATTVQDVLPPGWNALSIAQQVSVCGNWITDHDGALQGFERGYRPLSSSELDYFYSFWNGKCGTNF
jgi:hypothetical protein